VNAAAVKSTSSAAPVERKDGAPPTSKPAPKGDGVVAPADLKAMTDAKDQSARFKVLAMSAKKYGGESAAHKTMTDLYASLNKTPAAKSPAPQEAPPTSVGGHPNDEMDFDSDGNALPF
jgi:hypothetical protein